MFPLQAHRSLRLILFGAVLAITTGAHAADLRIKIPKRSKPTPVQKLNQDGVKAVQKHDYEKAKRLFYKAYLVDPNDPFTLNNLGYIAELEGEIERAQRYYALAAEQPPPPKSPSPVPTISRASRLTRSREMPPTARCRSIEPTSMPWVCFSKTALPKPTLL